MNARLRPAYYALNAGVWRDHVTLLHIPFTIWHLSYVVLGAAAAPVVYLDRLGGLTLAFLLAVGFSAHALDEYHGRPLRTELARVWLLSIAGLSLVGALAVGVVASLTISLWALPFVIFGALFVPAYNLELLGGRFHSGVWFGLGWGTFPALTGYWANAERLDFEAFVIASGCFALSLAQRSLSKRARELRRDAETALGHVEFRDGRVESITVPYLLEVPEAVLRLLGISVALLALGWLVARL